MKRAALISLCLLSLATAACWDSGGLAGLEEDPADIFWRLELDHHAINLSLDDSKPEYHTHKLLAMPLRLDGTPFPTEVKPTFVSSDTNRVRVDQDGLITAKSITATNSPVRIIATMTAGRGPITNVDTAFVVVTPNVREIETFSIRPLRNTLGVGYDTIMAARALGPGNQPVTGIRVAYSSSLPKVISYSETGLVMPRTMGKSILRASTLNYGTEHRDSVEITVTEPEVFQVLINYLIDEAGRFVMYPDPGEITIKAGHGVVWTSATGVVMGLTFDDPTHVGASPIDGQSGNLGIAITLPPNPRPIRMFNVPGTYEYTVAGSGAGVTPRKGRIVVTP